MKKKKKAKKTKQYFWILFPPPPLPLGRQSTFFKRGNWLHLSAGGGGSCSTVLPTTDHFGLWKLHDLFARENEKPIDCNVHEAIRHSGKEKLSLNENIFIFFEGAVDVVLFLRFSETFSASDGPKIHQNYRKGNKWEDPKSPLPPPPPKKENTQAKYVVGNRSILRHHFLESGGWFKV